MFENRINERSIWQTTPFTANHRQNWFRI